jgi:hypothetical protein
VVHQSDTSPSVSTSAPSLASSDSSSSAGTDVGIAIGALACVLLLGVAFHFIRRYQKRKRDSAAADELLDYTHDARDTRRASDSSVALGQDSSSLKRRRSVPSLPAAVADPWDPQTRLLPAATAANNGQQPQEAPYNRIYPSYVAGYDGVQAQDNTFQNQHYSTPPTGSSGSARGRQTSGLGLQLQPRDATLRLLRNCGLLHV